VSNTIEGNVKLVNKIAKESAQALGIGRLIRCDAHGAVLFADEIRDVLKMRIHSYVSHAVEVAGPEVYDLKMEPNEMCKLIHGKVRAARDQLVRDLRAEADRIEGADGQIGVGAAP